jgi:ABC-type Fe3+-hydroxamate transport system substrate-binding protein
MRAAAWMPLLVLLAQAPETARSEVSAARRVVSMNPSLTAVLVALGAQDRIVGVDAFSARQHLEVASLPRVGSLFHPSLEGVVALEPDLVVLVPSFEQRDFRRRLGELAIPVLALDPLGFDEVLDSILQLGARVGASERARERVAAIRAARHDVEQLTRELARPRAVLVVQRAPLYIVGRGSFIDEMLEAAGAENLGSRLGDPYPRASIEWLVEVAPEVILDSAPDPQGAAAFWARWPSLPAVRQKRVIAIPQGQATLPGPYLDRALLDLARALHGSELEARVERRP